LFFFFFSEHMKIDRVFGCVVNVITKKMMMCGVDFVFFV